MPLDITNSRIRREGQLLFLGTENILGVQSININPEIEAVPLKYIGMKTNTVNMFPDEQQNGTINIQSLLINKDFFIQYTGNSLVNGYILKQQNNLDDKYVFTSGYMSNYNCKYSVNQVPTVSVTFVSPNVGKIASGQLTTFQNNQLNTIRITNYSTGLYRVPNIGSITLNLSDPNFVSNRVLTFEIDISPNKTPIYNMGNREPVDIRLITPLEVTLTFDIEASSYNFGNIQQFPQIKDIDNITIQVKDYSNNEQICSYGISGANLIKESYGIGIDNNLICNLTYKGYL